MSNQLSDIAKIRSILLATSLVSAGLLGAVYAGWLSHGTALFLTLANNGLPSCL